ncbi:hypothetical protein LSH36_302g05039 [Paralvinella palmiformis]|uniref:G-protein coupled receptors family 1 profile domain-containing protein n=1 Tax=Paralvinella palmiformis TaxID=53620 RepID=A0AAD9N3U3_9ANNE|nr:hypothetical protein LSH36_302g05039 [Paralvinella palmiformis]
MHPIHCLHLADTNDTTSRGVHLFVYLSEAVIQPTIFSIATVFGLIQILIEVIFYCGQVPEGRFFTPVIINNVLYMTFLMSISTSATLVVFIAFIRNMMYLKPIKSRLYFTTTIARRACGAIFVVTACLYTPTCLQVVWLGCYKETAMTSRFCLKVNDTVPNLKPVANGYLYVIVMLYGPVMLLAYVANLICIRITLNRRCTNVTGHLTGVHDYNNQRQSTVNRITRMLTIILICDVICTLPSIIQGVGLLFDPEENVFEKKNRFFELIDPISEIFLALRPTYNFWLYVYQRPEFRIRFCQMMTPDSWCRFYPTVFGLIQILIEVIFYCGQVPEGRFFTPVIINNVLYMTFLVSISTSATLVVFIAFIRNMMYLKPIKSRLYFTTTIARRACGAIFVVTCFIYSPNCLQETDDSSGFCSRVHRHIPNLEQLANGYLFLTVTLYGPVMLLAYVANLICIRITLNRRCTNVTGHLTGVHDYNNQRQSTVNRITRMLTIILICDAICTLPSIIQGVGLLFDPEENVFGKKNLFFELIDPISEIFLALRPTYNFWLYVYQRPEFRIRFCQMIKKTINRSRYQPRTGLDANAFERKYCHLRIPYMKE